MLIFLQQLLCNSLCQRVTPNSFAEQLQQEKMETFVLALPSPQNFMGKAGGGKWRDSNFLRWELNPCFLSPTTELLDERGLPLKLSKGLKHHTAGKRSQVWLPHEGIYFSTTKYEESKSLRKAQMLCISISDLFLCSWGLYDYWYKICALLGHQTVAVAHISASWLGCTT